MSGSKEMIQPSVFGQVIIITVHLPLLTFVGIEGKMFEPMAPDGDLRPDCRLHSFADLRTGHAGDLCHRKGAARRKTSLIRGAKRLYAPLLRRRFGRHWLRHLELRGALSLHSVLVHSPRTGIHSNTG